ncbi:MAG: sulfatase [Gemmatales bacterium]|nr:MAG: sulfatase [Gemmatales bacterium]
MHPALLRSRRAFLADVGMGFTGLALGAMLYREGIAKAAPSPWQPPTGQPHFTPKAKSVIWFFMIGGASHLETFDPKPAVSKYAGKSINETPFKEVLTSPYLENERIVAPDANGQIRTRLYPLQVGFKKRGQSGIEVSDWLPNIGDCIDDIAVIRSMWTEDSNHGAQLQFHTGRHRLDGYFPTIGAWVHYGLGSLNDNLPQFIVLGRPLADCCGGMEAHRANYLGPKHDGVPLTVDPKNPLPFALPERNVYLEEQQAEFGLLNRLNRLSSVEYPADEKMLARIKSYELAFRMQTAVPEVFDFRNEDKKTLDMYGKGTFAKICLSARRLVERGVRFVQIYHGSNGGAGGWDAHSGLKNNHTKNCAEIDRPIAALLKDLKQRGLLDETIVVWATEFGRTPGSQGATGRDHHPYGFSVWMAGGGIKGGIVHGATDELGFHAVEHRHYVTDIHATILHQLGLDPHRLAVPGRKRLEMEIGKPIKEIIA